jgi:hypothetical protein
MTVTKKVVDVLKEIVIRTSMHEKGVGLEGDDRPCMVKMKMI